MEESNLYLKIANLKGKFDRVHSFNHKYAIESVIKTLDDYMDIPDISFKRHVDEQFIYSKMKTIKNIRFHNSIYNLINNNYKLVSNMIVPYAIEDKKQVSLHRGTYIDQNTGLKIIGDFLIFSPPACFFINSQNFIISWRRELRKAEK